MIVGPPGPTYSTFRTVPVARYQHLPLYQACYALTRELYRLRGKFPKTLKYDLRTTACASAIRCLKLIVVANGRTAKEPPLRELLIEIECLWTYSRLLHDLRGVSSGEFKTLSVRLSEIGSQAQAWMSWEKKAARSRA